MISKEQLIEAIKKNEGMLYKIASVYTDSAEDRKDLMQEMIYNLWRSFDSYNNTAALTTWMYRVALNVAIYNLKISRRKVSTVSIEEIATHPEDPDDRANEERITILRRHLNDLNLLEKGIIMLYLEDKSYREISAITGLTESNVGTRIARIREKLKKQINK